MLIPCYECKKKVSSNAVACPSCGAKIEGRVCPLCGSNSVTVGFDYGHSSIVYEFVKCESCNKSVGINFHPNFKSGK